MGYLNEDGLATLVGKVKGQVVQLTAAEYRQIPAETKNTDNKIYFVEDDDYAYAIDNEPTLNSENLVKSGGVYNYTSKIGTGALTTTAQTLIPAVNELKAAVDTNTSGIVELNNGLTYNSGDLITFNNYSARFAATTNSRNEILFTIPFDKRFSTNNVSLVITDYYFETSAGVVDEQHGVSLNVPIDFILWIGITARVSSTRTLTSFVGGVFMFNGRLTVN